ncbi:probable serine hydrolase isoform X2 [Lepeophtheirus salmonis]|uniref:probable serine hydrolase isoform X2 n=1 Tax=Lepeophtheirus salmonis TaxID=72036 RepID=UPI001AE4DECB|nr:probable serine hydrolase isoform X2 [Lepeophtheirus salmonis]
MALTRLLNGSGFSVSMLPFRSIVMGSHSLSSSTSGYVAKEISIPVHWGQVCGKLWEEPSPGKKKTIFGLHGWMDNANSMDGIAPKLPPGYKFYSFDQPGCGFSSPNADAWGYNFAHIFLWIKHMKLELGLKEEKISIIGFSLGAVFAQMYACLSPSDIDKIVQIDIIHGPILPQSNQLHMLQVYMTTALRLNKNIHSKQKPPEYDYEEAIEIYMKAYAEFNGENALTRKSAEILMNRGLEKTPSGKYKWRMDPRVGLPALNNLSQEIVDIIATSVKHPLLLIKATDSCLYVEPNQAERFLSLLREGNPKFKFLTSIPVPHQQLSELTF